MKKYPKLVQCDARGQIVIPKDIRSELKIGEGTGFWVYSITDEGILLKMVDREELDDSRVLSKLESKADKIKLNKKNLAKSVKRYKKTKSGNLEVL